CSGFGHITRNCTQPKHLQNSEFKDKMLLMQAQENSAVLDEEKSYSFLLANECDAFNSDIDDEPTAHTIFMANLPSARPAHQHAGPSHASTLSKVQNLDNDVDHVDVNHKEHKIHNEVQQPIVVESYTVETGNSNIIPYEQYLKNNEAFVVLNDVSSVLKDDSLAIELAIYKEQVGVCEQRAKFKLTERYQNPCYLNKAKRAQPALYDGHEILKTNHVPVIVPTSEEDLELADISREKMIEKVKDPECVK
nr:hypothetical protein [Tanacetum cinerariifolium]